jgi:hypothetical protein
MTHPFFLCTGVVRSGSTWSFNVVRTLASYFAQQTGHEMASAYLDPADLDRFVQNEMNNLPGPTVVKAHGIGPRALGLLQTGRAKAVCTVRDPRDCVASDLKFLKKDISHSVRRVADNMQMLSKYEGGSHTLFVQYEQMMANPLKQIHRIAGHLGVDAEDSTLRQIDVACGIPACRAAIEVLKKMDPKDVMWMDTHRVNPENQLHDNHIDDARVGKWKDAFTAAQADRLTTMFKPWLVKFGYETPVASR